MSRQFISQHDHIVNPALLELAKMAFVPGGDPSMGGGGDPSMGGAPADPAAGGGAPPMDPAAMGGMPPSDPRIDQLMAQMQQMQQQMSAGAGGGAGAGGAGGAGLKPKIDVNVEIMQIKNILAKICDALGVTIPVQDMVATPEKLTAMAQGQSAASAAGGAGAGAGGAIGGIPPMDPMQGAGQPGGEKTGQYHANGVAFDTNGLDYNANKAAAILRIRARAGTSS